MNRAKRKRDALMARALAALDTDRAERHYRRHDARVQDAIATRDGYRIVQALGMRAEADIMWVQARKRGLMVETIWRR